MYRELPRFQCCCSGGYVCCDIFFFCRGILIIQMIGSYGIVLFQLKHRKLNRNFLPGFNIMLTIIQIEIKVIGHNLIRCQIRIIRSFLKG